jgi:hypothetical protein
MSKKVILFVGEPSKKTTISSTGTLIIGLITILFGSQLTHLTKDVTFDNHMTIERKALLLPMLKPDLSANSKKIFLTRSQETDLLVRHVSIL